MAAKTIFVLLIFTSMIFAGDKNLIPWKGTAELMNSSKELNANTKAYAFADAKPHFKDEISEKKSPGLAFGLSLVIPGTGQYYNESYWRSALYAGIEIFSWTMVAVYNSKGADEDAVFRQFADEHWDEVVYWAKVYQKAKLEEYNSFPDLPEYGWDVTVQPDLPAGILPDWINDGFYDTYLVDLYLQNYLRDIETDVATYYTHILPSTKTQQYYEMIGKYSRQFGNAWDDAVFDKMYDGYQNIITPNNKEYYDMRNLSNDYYDIAGNWLSVILVNHLVSGLDALLTARSINKKIEISYIPKFIDGKLVNAYALNIKF